MVGGLVSDEGLYRVVSSFKGTLEEKVNQMLFVHCSILNVVYSVFRFSYNGPPIQSVASDASRSLMHPSTSAGESGR